MFGLFKKRSPRLPIKMPSDFCLRASLSNGFANSLLSVDFMEDGRVEMKSQNGYPNLEKAHLTFTLPEATLKKLYEIILDAGFLTIEILERQILDGSSAYIEVKWKGFQLAKGFSNGISSGNERFDTLFDKIIGFAKMHSSIAKKSFFVEVDSNFWFRDKIEFYKEACFKSKYSPSDEDISALIEKDNEIRLSIDHFFDKIEFSSSQVIQITPGIFTMEIHSNFGKVETIRIDFSNTEPYAGIRLIETRDGKTSYVLLMKA